MKKLACFISTLGPIGYAKWAPGTFGSLAAILAVPFVPTNEILIVVFILSVVIGVWASSVAAQVFGRHDPSIVIIDEVCGILATFLFVPVTVKTLIAGFILFRFFDIVKPFPVRSLERFPGGFGVVLDDVGAGLYSNLILHLLIRYAVL